MISIDLFARSIGNEYQVIFKKFDNAFNANGIVLDGSKIFDIDFKPDEIKTLETYIEKRIKRCVSADGNKLSINDLKEILNNIKNQKCNT